LTLLEETPDNILLIAQFDAWLKSTLSYTCRPPAHGLTDILSETLSRRRKKDEATAHDDRPQKRRHGLVIPHSGLRLNQNTQFATTTERITLVNSSEQPAVMESVDSNAGSSL
jgi:hypothetical protein